MKDGVLKGWSTANKIVAAVILVVQALLLANYFRLGFAAS